MRYLPILLALPLAGCGMFHKSAVPIDYPMTVTPSGVSYQDLYYGVGHAAETGDEVTIDYTAELEDGTKVDSSRDRGVPVTFVIGEAPIQGWNEGLLGMRISGRRYLLVPPILAYGSQGVPGLIPPGAMLAFEVELIKIAGVE